MRELTAVQKQRIDASEKWPVRMETELHDDGTVTYSVSVGGTQDTDNGFGIWDEMATRGSTLAGLLEMDQLEVAQAVLQYLGVEW